MGKAKREDGKLGFRITPIGRILPNMITIASICFGLTSIRFALDQKWELAAIFILIAGFTDAMDGRVARFFKASSEFGAQLDSLADFVNFGLCPAFVMYLWQLHNIAVPRIGWAVVLYFVICTAIRLARFNVDIDNKEKPAWMNKFFTGVPSTAGGTLAILPLVMSFEFPNLEILKPEIIAVYLVILGTLMPSKLPTFSIKRFVIRHEYVYIVLLCAGLLIAALIIEPWLSLMTIGIVYMSTFPFSYYVYKKHLNSK